MGVPTFTKNVKVGQPPGLAMIATAIDEMQIVRPVITSRMIGHDRSVSNRAGKVCDERTLMFHIYAFCKEGTHFASTSYLRIYSGSEHWCAQLKFPPLRKPRNVGQPIQWVMHRWANPATKNVKVGQPPSILFLGSEGRSGSIFRSGKRKSKRARRKSRQQWSGHLPTHPQST